MSEKCGNCGGLGELETMGGSHHDWVTCRDCKGTGIFTDPKPPPEVELLPCPFCGGEGVDRKADIMAYYVECNKCEVGTKFQPTPRFAAQLWNRRAAALNHSPDTRILSELVEAVKAANKSVTFRSTVGIERALAAAEAVLGGEK